MVFAVQLSSLKPWAVGRDPEPVYVWEGILHQEWKEVPLVNSRPRVIGNDRFFCLGAGSFLLALILIPTCSDHCWTSVGGGFVALSVAGGFAAAMVPGLVKTNMVRPPISSSRPHEKHSCN